MEGSRYSKNVLIRIRKNMVKHGNVILEKSWTEYLVLKIVQKKKSGAV